jgi:hypothetical protein
MGISLRDLKQADHWFDVNFWNWRPIVELIRQLTSGWRLCTSRLVTTA